MLVSLTGQGLHQTPVKRKQNNQSSGNICTRCLRVLATVCNPKIDICMF